MRKFKWLMFISILFVLTGAIVTEVFANAHNYSIFGSAVSNTGGGDLSLDMALNAELTLENEINASVSLTGDTFTKGTLRLLMNDYGDNYKNELNSVWIDSVTTVVPLYGNQSIAALSPNWQDKNGVEVMKIYARYETDNGIQWVGPVYIKREPVQNVINLTVDINPATAVIDGAQWQYQGSLEWYNSGDTISIDINDFVSASNPFAKPKLTIEYRNITGWTLPATEIVYLKEGEDIHRTGMYSNFQCKVTAFSITDPAQAPIFNSAYWRVLLYESGKESAFFPDGYDLDLFPGETWIQFKDFDGYVAPGDQDNKIDFIAKSGQRHQYNVEYCKQIPETPKIYGMRKNVYTDKVVFSIYPVASPDCQARQDIKYNIYRSEFNDPQTASLLVEKTENTEITIEKKDGSNNGLEHGKIYFFWVTAVATKPAGSGESPLSSRGEAAFLKLDKPTDLVVEARITDNALQFNAVDGAEIYEIRRSQDDTNLDDSIPCDIDDSISLGTTEQTVFVDNQDLEAYIKYTYWVIPKNNFQEGATSDGKSAHIIISPPDSIQIDDSTCDCLSFDFPLNPMATHYRWDRSESPIPGKKSRTNEFTTPPFTDCQLISGVRYAYVVQACNAHGCSAWSNESPKTAKLCPVSGVKATDKDPEYLKGVKVEWTDSPKATYYKVHACTSATYSTGCWTMKTSSNPFLHDRSNDPQILNYPAYYYFVTAYNNDTESITVGVDEGSPYRCLYQMSPTTSYFGPDGGTGSFEISEVNGCGFVLKTDSESWITDLSPKTGGDGNETVTFKVAPYEGATERIGYIEVMGDDANKVVKHKVVQDSRVSLTVNVNPPNAGSVSIQPSPLHQEGNKYFFAKDTVVTVQAIPVEPFQFDYWSGFVHDTVNPKTFILSSSGTLTANFSYPKKTLSITGQGSVELDNEGNAHNLPHQILVDQGTDVIVKSNLTCNSGYQWDGVTNIDPTQQSVVVKVENDMSISVECCSGWNFSMNALRTDTGSDTESIQIGSGCQDFTNEAALDARFYLTSAEKDVKYALQYKKATEEKPFWIIAVETGTEDVTLQWTAPEDEYFYQLRESASGIGKSVVWDMKATNSFTVSASSEVQYFTVHQSKIKWPMIIRSVRASSKPYVIMGVESVGYTMEAPPLLNPEYATSLVILPRLKADVRQAGNEVETWTIKVNPVGEYGNEEIATSTLIWEPMTFISEGHFRMYQGKDTLGDIVVENMRTTTSYDVTGDFGYQYFTIEWSNRPNDCPDISEIDDQYSNNLKTIGPINFTVTDSDNVFNELTLSPMSSDTNVVPVSNIQFAGSGSNRTVSITPIDAGQTKITIIVSDGNCQDSTDFMVTVDPDKPALYFNTDIDHGRNQTSDIPIEITNVTDLGGFEMKIHFDPSFITVNSVALGDFLGSTGRSPNVLVNDIDNENGLISFAAMTFAGPSGATGHGTMLTINVTTTSKAGATGLTLTDVQVTDTVGEVMPLVLENQSIIIGRAMLSIEPPEMQCFNECTSTVYISDVDDLGAYEVEVTYDYELFSVEIEKIEIGDFITSTGRSLIILPGVDIPGVEVPDGVIKFADGAIKIAAATLGNAEGASGEGILFKIIWKVSYNDTGSDIETPIQFDVNATQLTTTDGSQIPFRTKDQTVVIPACYLYDVDCDCDVDIADIMKVVGKYPAKRGEDKYIARYDIDSDGDIDIADIMKVVGKYPWKCPESKKGKRGRSRKNVSPQPLRQPLPPVTIGETFATPMVALGLENVAAFEYKLSFNKDAYQVVEIQYSDFIENTGREGKIGKSLFDNTTGYLTYGVFTLDFSGLIPGVYGNGTLNSIIWKRIGEGPCNFTLEELQVTDPVGDIIETKILDPFTIVQHVSTTEIEVNENQVTGFMHAEITQSGDIVLNWTLPVGENEEYHIYRAETPDGSYEEVTDELVSNFQEDLNIQQFIDEQVTGGTTYFYRIDVVDSLTGNSMMQMYSEDIPALNNGIGIRSDDCEISPADINGDCEIDLKDVLIILQRLTGIQTP